MRGPSDLFATPVRGRRTCPRNTGSWLEAFPAVVVVFFRKVGGKTLRRSGQLQQFLPDALTGCSTVAGRGRHIDRVDYDLSPLRQRGPWLEYYAAVFYP